ncbi:MAG TPA: hypothetical protein VJ866_02680 [Pyrinomonadaceae bacterium]|nr:hypothetical protein [Pyrinomonadaceae bacterium]
MIQVSPRKHLVLIGLTCLSVCALGLWLIWRSKDEPVNQLERIAYVPPINISTPTPKPTVSAPACMIQRTDKEVWKGKVYRGQTCETEIPVIAGATVTVYGACSTKVSVGEYSYSLEPIPWEPGCTIFLMFGESEQPTYSYAYKSVVVSPDFREKLTIGPAGYESDFRITLEYHPCSKFAHASIHKQAEIWADRQKMGRL